MKGFLKAKREEMKTSVRCEFSNWFEVDFTSVLDMLID